MKKIDKKVKQLVKICVEDVFLKGKLDEQKALKYLILFKKGTKVEAISFLKEYQGQIKRRLTQTTLVIESATDLSPAQVSDIKQKFSKEFQILNSEVKINKDILGGIRVKIGDSIFDDSLQVKIKSIGAVIAS